MVARSRDGSVMSFPVVQTIHKNNICHTTETPALVPASVQEAARQVAEHAVECLEGGCCVSFVCGWMWVAGWLAGWVWDLDARQGSPPRGDWLVALHSCFPPVGTAARASQCVHCRPGVPPALPHCASGHGVTKFMPGPSQNLRLLPHPAGAGVFGVEMFLLPDGSLLLNEVAPRPHNSGHYTIEACATSQYEVRVVGCGVWLASMCDVECGGWHCKAGKEGGGGLGRPVGRMRLCTEGRTAASTCGAGSPPTCTPASATR